MSDIATIDSPEIPSQAYNVSSNIRNEDILRSILDVRRGNVLFPLRLQVQDIRPENWVRIAIRRFRWFFKFIFTIPVLPAAKLLHFAFHYEPDDEDDLTDDLDVVNVGGPQWEAAIAGIAYSWKMCQLTSTGLIACVLAVLQIQPIFASTTTRTFVMASIMFSCSSLVSSCLYIASKESFLKRRVRNKWKAALDATDEFWTLVALPVSFIMWSSGFFFGTLLLLIWNTFGTMIMADSDSSFAVSALFLTSIPIASLFKIYYSMRKIHGL